MTQSSVGRELEKGGQGLRKGDTHVLPAEKAWLSSESEETKGKVSVSGREFWPFRKKQELAQGRASWKDKTSEGSALPGPAEWGRDVSRSQFLSILISKGESHQNGTLQSDSVVLCKLC